MSVQIVRDDDPVNPVKGVTRLDEHVIEIISDSGEGAQRCGQSLGSIAARMGNGIWTVEIIPAEITIFSDGSFRFELKSPPSTFLIMKAAGIEKGSPVPQSQKVGKVSRKQLEEIAEVKRKDMNTDNIDAIVRQLEGTALQMGVEVTD